MYDLERDPIELHNLAQDPSHASTLKEMREELERLKKETAYPEGKQLGAPPSVAEEKRADKPEGMVLSYDFTRDEAERAADLSGNGHHGALNGARFVEEDGKRALRLDGQGFIDIPPSETLDPSKGPWTVQACVKSDKPDGIILAHGGESYGYVLFLKNGRAHAALRMDGQPTEVASEKPVGEGWVHLAAVIGRDRALKVYLDGNLVGKKPGVGFLVANPQEGLQIGTDAGTHVGTYDAPFSFVGLIGSVRIWAGERSAEQIAEDARV